MLTLHAVTCPEGLDLAAMGHYRGKSCLGVALGPVQAEQTPQGSLRTLNKSGWKSSLLKAAGGTELGEAAAPGRGLMSKATWGNKSYLLFLLQIFMPCKFY